MRARLMYMFKLTSSLIWQKGAIVWYSSTVAFTAFTSVIQGTLVNNLWSVIYSL